MKNHLLIGIGGTGGKILRALRKNMFQKLVAVRNADALKLLEKMEYAENGGGSNVPLRSKRFLTFGIKRLAAPEIEIREYLTYKFARQAASQLRFNNWEIPLAFVMNRAIKTLASSFVISRR